MMRQAFFIMLFVILGSQVKAQQALEAYIDSALTQNIVLQQKSIELEKAEYALKIAKGLFYPQVNLSGDYVHLNGNVRFELPTGDLLNGVYSTLNELTQTESFPQIENEPIEFSIKDFYGAHAMVQLPIFNSEMIYNKRIKQSQLKLTKEEEAIYKRDLIKEVKEAYYTFLQATEVVDVYKSTLALAKEGKRVNEKLLKHGKALPAYVLRAESEVEEARTQVFEAEKDANNARRLFNFLLNRNQEAKIDTTSGLFDLEHKVLTAINQTLEVSNREEIEAFEDVIAIRDEALKMNKSFYYPSLNGFGSVGVSGSDWDFVRRGVSYIVGLKLDIPLFAGNQNRNKIKQAELDVKTAELDKEKLKQQLELSYNVAKNELESAYRNYLSAKKQFEAAGSYQRLIKRGFDEGVNTYIETVDARGQLTKSKINLSLMRYNLYKALAKVERETANYNLD